VTQDVIEHILSTSYESKVAKLLDQSTLSGISIVDIVKDEVEKRIEIDFQDIYPPKNSTKYISNLFTLSVLRLIPESIDKRIHIDRTKEYKSRYKMMWE